MQTDLNRREFLIVSSGALAATALHSTPLTAADSVHQKRSLKKGIMYATVGVKGSVLEKFKAIKAAGFDGVEPMSHMNQDEVMKAFEETGLKAASTCCNTHWNKPVSDPNPKVRAEGLEGLKQALRDAKRYGASSVLFVPAVVNQQVSYADAYQRSQQEIRKAIPLAEELGVKIAIENVWNHFLLSPLEVMWTSSTVRGSAGISMSGTSSPTAGRSNGFAFWANAFKNCTSRNSAVKRPAVRGWGRVSTSNS